LLKRRITKEAAKERLLAIEKVLELHRRMKEQDLTETRLLELEQTFLRKDPGRAMHVPGSAPGTKSIRGEPTNRTIAWNAFYIPFGLVVCGFSLNLWTSTPVEAKFGWPGAYWLLLALVQLCICTWGIWQVIEAFRAEINLKILQAQLEAFEHLRNHINLLDRLTDILRNMALAQKLDADTLALHLKTATVDSILAAPSAPPPSGEDAGSPVMPAPKV
jgi:hypothetical protein